MLTFDEELHEYRFNGVVIPSVTTIISAVGLYEFDHVAAETLDVAAARGKVVHRCIEWYELGTLDESSIDPELYGYFESYLATKAAGLLPERPESVEKRLFSRRFRYAGTLDQMFENDWINDIKTGLPGAEHGLQLSAYWLAEYEDINCRPSRLTGTYLNRDGSVGKVLDYPYEPLAWLAVLTDYKWRKANNKIKPRWR